MREIEGELQPAAHICSLTLSPMFLQPMASSTSRTLTWPEPGARTRRPSARPAALFPQESLSKWIVCRAAWMSSSSASKNAPFWKIPPRYCGRHAERHAGDRRNRLLKGRFRLELEVNLVPLDRPDGDAEHYDREHQHGVDPGHGDKILKAPLGHASRLRADHAPAERIATQDIWRSARPLARPFNHISPRRRVPATLISRATRIPS